MPTAAGIAPDRHFVPDERKAGGPYVSLTGVAMETVVPSFTFVKGVLRSQRRLYSLISLIEKNEQWRHRRPSTCLPSRCSLTLAISERQNENLTKNAFSKRLLLTLEHTLVNVPLLIFFMGYLGKKQTKCRLFQSRRLEKEVSQSYFSVLKISRRFSNKNKRKFCQKGINVT